MPPVSTTRTRSPSDAPPTAAEIREVLVAHLEELYRLYGRELGVRVARKHIGWTTKGLAGAAEFRGKVNRLESCAEQLAEVERFLAGLEQQEPSPCYDNQKELAA